MADLFWRISSALRDLRAVAEGGDETLGGHAISSTQGFQKFRVTIDHGAVDCQLHQRALLFCLPDTPLDWHQLVGPPLDRGGGRRTPRREDVTGGVLNSFVSA
jgi:hypothetical protein